MEVGSGWCCFIIAQKGKHIFIDILLETEACEGTSSYIQVNMVMKRHEIGRKIPFTTQLQKNYLSKPTKSLRFL
jgi:hypothetical protein